MPAKAKVKKKKSRERDIARLMSPAEQKKFQREVDKLMDDADEEATKRAEWADRIISAQDEKTRQAFESMHETLLRLAHANGAPKAYVHVEGWPGSTTIEQPRSLLEKNLRYTAVKMIVDAAEFGVRMENFKMPKPKKKNKVV